MPEQKEVFFNGVRDESYRKKGEETVTERFVADMYMPGVGAYDVLLTAGQYARFLNLQPGTQMLQGFKIEVRNSVVSNGKGSFAVRRPEVRFLDLELLEAGKAAKAS